jgi:hypothetical protein
MTQANALTTSPTDPHRAHGAQGRRRRLAAAERSARLTNSTPFLDNATHSMLTEDKTTAAKSSRAIRDVVNAARTGQPLVAQGR